MSKATFEFVKSLTMREKAYFKRFTDTYSGKKEKNYLMLYDAMLSMDKYDTYALKQRFEGSTIAKYLSSESDYLEEQLLKSLANFYFDSTPQRELQKDILFVDILIDKGFPKRALKILSQAKKIAYRFEDFSTTLTLIQLEEEILFKEGILGFTKKLEKLQAERQQLYDQIQNLNQLRLLREQAREMQFTIGFVTDPSRYPEFYAHPLLESPDTALSRKAKEHWHYTKASLAYSTRNYQESQKQNGECIALMESNSHLFKKAKLLPFLSNFLYDSAMFGDKDSFFKYLPKLVKLEQDQTLDQVYVRYIKYTRLFELHYRMQDPSSTSLLMDKAGSFIRANHLKMSNTQIDYCLQLMVRAGIMTGRFEEAIDWLNWWQQMGALEHSIIYLRLFSLILHYDMGWNDLLGTEIDASSKVLRRHLLYDDLVKVLIGFFKKQLKQKKHSNKCWIELRQDLETIRSDPEKNQAFEYFDFLAWCEERTEKSFGGHGIIVNPLLPSQD